MSGGNKIKVIPLVISRAVCHSFPVYNPKSSSWPESSASAEEDRSSCSSAVCFLSSLYQVSDQILLLPNETRWITHTWNCGDWTATFRMGRMRRAGERCSASCLPLRKRRRRRRRLVLRRRRWRRRWLLVLGGSVVKLQRLPDLPELLVDQLQSQRAVQCLRGKKNDDEGGWRVKQLFAESPFNVH